MPLVTNHAASPLTVATWWDQVNTVLSAHASWALTEQVVSGAATANVWHNTANDFYFTSIKTASAINFVAHEGYDAAAHNVIRPVPSTANGDTTAPGADFSYGNGAAYPLFSAAATINPVLYAYTRSALTTGGQSVAANARGVLVSMSGNVRDWLYVGMFDSLATATDAKPFGALNMTVAGRVSRYPTVTATQAGNWGTNPPTLWTPTSGLLNGRLDRLYNLRAVGSRLAVTHGGNPDTNGGLRGLLPDTVLQFAHTTPPALGDTMTIGADTWEIVNLSAAGAGNSLLMNRAAA